MPPKLDIAMSSGGDMKVPLNLVAFQTSEDSTRVWGFASTQFGCLCKLSAAFSHVSKDMANMLIFFLSFQPLSSLLVQKLIGRLLSRFAIYFVGPELPIGLDFGQELSREYPVTCGILHIDM